MDLEGYQRWMRVVAAQQAEGYVPAESDCATVELSGGEGAVAGTLCPAPFFRRSTDAARPALALEVGSDASWLGARHVLLAPADPSSVLGIGYLRMVAEEGQRVPLRKLVDLSVNGSGWGTYVLEASAVDVVSIADGAQTSGIREAGVLVQFGSSELPYMALVTPERSFAYSRTELTLLDGAASAGVSPDDDGLTARAAELLTGIEAGTVLPSAAVDPQALGRLVAATALWHGAALDWRTLALVFDPGTGRFSPVPVGSVPDPTTPLPSSFVDDPVIQRAIAARMDQYCAPGLVDSVLADGDLDAMYVALGGEPGGLRAILLEHQSALRALVAPSRTLFASIAEEPGSARLHLSAVLPFPVELVGLDINGQGVVPLDPAWVPGESAALAVVEGNRVALSARIGPEPVTASLRVPLASLPSDLRIGQGTLSLITRVWGLETSIPVPVDTVPVPEVP